MIEVKSITKVFKRSGKDIAQIKAKNKKEGKKEKVSKTVVAVDRLSFTAKPGEIFGLLGGNGAGKTTTLRCVSSLYKPTEGEIFIDGVNVIKDPNYARTNIAFLTSELKLDKYFTPDYTLTYYGRLRGMTESQIKERKEELFDLLDVHDFRNKKVGDLSTGMLQKVSIAVSIIHNPSVIIFDEPTNGLDIVTARRITDFLIDQRNKGKTVIISTHIMALVEKLCDKVGIIMEGALAIEGTRDEILEETKQTDLEEAFFYLLNKKEEETKTEDQAENQAENQAGDVK